MVVFYGSVIESIANFKIKGWTTFRALDIISKAKVRIVYILITQPPFQRNGKVNLKKSHSPYFF